MVLWSDCWSLAVAVIVMTCCQSDSRQSHYQDVKSLSSAGLEMDRLLSQPSGQTQAHQGPTGGGYFDQCKKSPRERQNVQKQSMGGLQGNSREKKGIFKKQI